MMTAFITIRILDILDVLLVAFMLYKIYMAIKGTVAFNIFMGIFIFYITWIIIKGLNMELMGNILGQVMAAGVVALVVVFQQEIRKMFLTLGTHYKINTGLTLENLFSKNEKGMASETIREIVTACERMGRAKTGALIVLTNKAELNEYIDTGEKLDAVVSMALLETIFFKNSPLHDGGVIVQGNIIRAARCILPVSNKKLKNVQLGLRHRAALGMSMATDAQIIIVSEETGRISYSFNGKLKENVNPIELTRLIEEVYAE